MRVTVESRHARPLPLTGVEDKAQSSVVTTDPKANSTGVQPRQHLPLLAVSVIFSERSTQSIHRVSLDQRREREKCGTVQRKRFIHTQERRCNCKQTDSVRRPNTPDTK